jgi:hypothetical protein
MPRAVPDEEREGAIAQPDDEVVVVSLPVSGLSVVGGPGMPQVEPVHATQVWLVASHEFFVASLQSPFVAQPRHAPPEQIGVAGLAEHCAFVVQPPLIVEPHVLIVVLQT